MGDAVSRPPGNRLIDALPAEERSAILEHAEDVSLTPGEVLADAGQPLSHGYFPKTGVLSIVTVLEDGSMIEAATVGNEGMVGVQILLGAASSPNTRTMCQIRSESMRISSDRLARLAEELPSFRFRLLRYTHALLVQAAQSAVCNRRHSAEQRAAKWLLQSHDRVQGDEFHLTQEFLAIMLGVRRASVAVVAKRLRDDGLIDYRRGDISITDRRGLERLACVCYRQVRDEYDAYLAAGGAPAEALGTPG